MTAPINTYSSAVALALGHVPQGAEDNEPLYRELLDIHNAIEGIAIQADTSFQSFIDKYRNNTKVVLADSPYTVLTTDGTVEVDATAGDITIVLYPVAEGVGYRHEIKRIDTVTTSKVTLVGDTVAGELIDGHSSGINISTQSSYTVKTNNDADGWNIL